jgi:hypothetical protein
MWSHIFPLLEDEDHTDDDEEEEARLGPLPTWKRAHHKKGMLSFVESINQLPKPLPRLHFLYMPLDGGLLPAKDFATTKRYIES